MAHKILLIIFLVNLFSSCSLKKTPALTIAINPWPGYEFLYLAEKKGFFQETGLNVKLLQLGSLSDARRAYVNGSADGFASTIIEAVQANVESDRPLKIVMVPDYSNGGDVILAQESIKSTEELKGKTVGCEVDSLGIYLLHRALSYAGLSLSDINVVNVAQMRGEQAMTEKEIDAYVSYPPVSVAILKNEGFHTIFTSAQIPNEIIDTVSISEEALERDPELVGKLYKAWQMALDYYKENKASALAIMSAREKIAPEEFEAILADLKILDAQAQGTIFKSPEVLNKATTDVCETLVHVKAIQTDCNNFPNIIN